MDESVKQPSPSIRHRLDTGSAASRPMEERHGYGNGTKPAHDGPRADGRMAAQELRRSAEGSAGSGSCDPRVERLDFGEALAILRRGGRVAREGWNGKGQFIALAFGAHFAGPSLPDRHPGVCLVIQPTSGALVPWTASQTDLLACDWCLVREEKVLVYGHGSPQADGARPETGHREEVG